jgi:acetyl-CoA carboxylase carboxyltransferase component
LTEEEEEATRVEEEKEEQEQKVEAFFKAGSLFLGFRFLVIEKWSSGEKGKGFVNGIGRVRSR